MSALLPSIIVVGQLVATVALPSGEELLRQGDRLADRGDTAAALMSYKLAFERLLPKLRGLSFQRPVEAGTMTRAELRAHLMLVLDRDVPPEELALLSKTLTAFGFVDEPWDAETLLLRLYTEEIAGFYDSKTKRLSLVDDGAEVLGSGRIKDFDKSAKKIALSHEMIHALADQHFDLDSLHEVAKDDDDMELALASLIEGEATLAMLADFESGADLSHVLMHTPEELSTFLGVFKRLAPFIGGSTFRDAPEIIRASMIFPYLNGAVFVLHLLRRGGWQEVNAAYASPPVSTEQVLFPEKLLGERDDPIRLSLPDFTPELSSGWRHLGGDSLGQMQVAVLLGVEARSRVAAGWDGDRYEIFAHEGHGEALIWLSTWDTQADAMEFAAAYANRLLGRLTKRGPRPRPQGVAGTLLFVQGEKAYSVERRGQDVSIIEGVPLSNHAVVAERVFNATRTHKRYPSSHH